MKVTIKSLMTYSENISRRVKPERVLTPRASPFSPMERLVEG